MKRERIEQVLKDAVQAGVLPDGVSERAAEARPWPVVLLTALGAWLAAIPLAGAVWFALSDVLSHGVGPYLSACPLLLGAVAVLRSRSLGLFAEQLAVPALLAGGVLLAIALSDDLPSGQVSAVLAALALCIAAAIGQSWLRVTLGFVASALAVRAILPVYGGWFGLAYRGPYWLALHVVFAAWLAAGALQAQVLNDGARARAAAAVESVAAGWLLATLAGMALCSGSTFLLGASVIGRVLGEISSAFWQSGAWSVRGSLRQTVSVVLALAAAVVIARRWASTRQPWCGGLALAAVVLCWFMPLLGAVLLALALCGSSGRRTQATVAAAAAAWIICAFYYQLHWPLAAKAALLAGTGIVFGAFAAIGTKAHTATLHGLLARFTPPQGYACLTKPSRRRPALALGRHAEQDVMSVTVCLAPGFC
jgi:hypothetical protein